MFGLTRLASNYLITITSVILYALLGGLFNPILTLFLLLIVLLCLVFILSIPKNEDMDMLTAFCIHGRGANCPKGDTPLTMTQNCFIYFDGKLNFDDVKALICKQFYKYKRLSSIAVLKHKSSPLWTTKWKPIEITPAVQNRMIKKHVVESDDELYKLVDELCNQTLPKDLPLWIFHYIENNNGLSLWLWRVSHGIADGIRLVPVAAELLSDIDGKPVGAPTTGKLASAKNMKRAKKVRQSGGRKNMWLNPKTYVNFMKDLYQIHFSVNGPCDTLNVFKPDDKIHGPKLQVHVRNKIPFKIDDIKALKNKYNVSFNDVITALTCSGIRNYILSKDADYFKKNRRCTMTALLAFGFPPKEEFHGQSDWLRNGFSLTSWDFPVDVADFEKRLKIINRNAKKLKTSIVAPVTTAISEFLARLGLDNALDENGTKLFARHSCVFSSLPSWNVPLFYNGVKVAKLEASYFNWIPQFIFISYNEFVYGTLVVDPQRFPNAQLILDGMQEELMRQIK